MKNETYYNKYIENLGTTNIGTGSLGVPINLELRLFFNTGMIYTIGKPDAKTNTLRYRAPLSTLTATEANIMANIKIPKGWEIPESQVTPESDHINRRKFIKNLGLGKCRCFAVFFFKRLCTRQSALEKQLEPFRSQTLDAEEK